MAEDHDLDILDVDNEEEEEEVCEPPSGKDLQKHQLEVRRRLEDRLERRRLREELGCDDWELDI